MQFFAQPTAAIPALRRTPFTCDFNGSDLLNIPFVNTYIIYPIRVYCQQAIDKKTGFDRLPRRTPVLRVNVNVDPAVFERSERLLVKRVRNENGSDTQCKLRNAHIRRTGHDLRRGACCAAATQSSATTSAIFLPWESTHIWPGRM